ncbi:MAG: waaE [Crocinitomicaceae bacterium]|jgi:(heptosyl)LPS beta-1,4-glucosyltransferase|nr:waaE [Crocinitomicaceae bacterium]
MERKLSAVIITFNEERNIARCIESVLPVADDIVVLDSFSTDKTEEICAKYNVHFEHRPWAGYSASKNYANSLAKYDLILSIDADEALSEELRNSIQAFKSAGPGIAGKFNRLTNYCGHWIKYGGWYPDAKIRVFDRSVTHWTGEIHEELSFTQDTEIQQLKGDCLHYSYYSQEQHFRQRDKFTTIAAQDLFEHGKKAPWHKLIFSPVVKFIRDYFLKFGFLDGKTGFIIARISAGATYMKYKKLRDLNKGRLTT